MQPQRLNCDETMNPIMHLPLVAMPLADFVVSLKLEFYGCLALDIIFYCYFFKIGGLFFLALFSCLDVDVSKYIEKRSSA